MSRFFPQAEFMQKQVTFWSSEFMETCSQKSTLFDGFFYAVAQVGAKSAAHPEQFRIGTITCHK